MTGCDELFNVCAFEFMRGFTNADSISSMTSMVHDLAVPFQGFESGPSFALLSKEILENGERSQTRLRRGRNQPIGLMKPVHIFQS